MNGLPISRFVACGIASLSVACSSGTPASTDSPIDATAPTDAKSPETDGASPVADAADLSEAAAIVAARPYTLNVPPSYDATKPTPLVVMFHGYSASGQLEELYMGVTATSDSAGFLYAYGDGTIDDAGNRFWNATDGCCNFDGSKVDDVAYFDAIVDDVSSKYNVDPKRIFVLGHSNGGFMAHRLACDRAPRVASIVSLAGVVWEDPTKCDPANTVAILDVHGTADETIGYDGGATQSGVYPSELTTMATWSQKNGCTGALAATGQTLDIDTGLPGSETIVSTVGGCPTGIDVQLWTVQGGMHIPSLSPTWGSMVWGFFSTHPKP
jgi:polyhydroxybutyrate depolymerase